MKCRFCQHELDHEFIDLVNSPPSNSFLSFEELNKPEVYYPLKLFVCEECFLVQVDEYKKSDEIFSDQYIYFSSYSRSWLEHAKAYVEMITKRLELTSNSFVTEVASNDGYLLQYFKEKGIPCLGIEPARRHPGMDGDLLEALVEDAHQAAVPAHPNLPGQVLGRNRVIAPGDLHMAVPVHLAAAFIVEGEGLQRQRL